MSHEPTAPVAVAPGVWCVTQSLPFLGLDRRMTVFVQPEGVTVHSPIVLRPEDEAWLASLGPVTTVVVPNRFHRMDAPAFAARYPEARVLAPAGVRKQVEKVVRVDVVADDVAPVAGVEGLTWWNLPGTAGREVAGYWHHEGEGTFLVTDALFNMPAEGRDWMSRFYFGFLKNGGRLHCTTTFRLVGVRNRRALADAFRSVAALPGLGRIMVGHGEVVVTDAARKLSDAADALAR